MSGYCKECGNQMCLCDEINEWREEVKKVKIQLTADQARELCRIGAPKVYTMAEVEQFVCNLSHYGYIKKSAVEEAEKEYLQYSQKRHNFHPDAQKIIYTLHEAIVELKENQK